MTSSVFVVDAGVIFTNWHQKNPRALMFTTESVLDEIRNRPSSTRMDTLISIGRLKVSMPCNAAIKRVHEVAIEAGDKTSLSTTDVELIALGLDLQETNSSVTLVSTDLSLLNTAVHLGLKTIDTSQRMRHKIRWILKCPACGHSQPESSGTRECPVCGTEMKRRPSERRRIHK